MNTFSAVITGSSIVLAEVNDAGLTSWLIAEEARPESLLEADRMLAAHGYGRTEAWDLTGAGLHASVAPIDNRFNGTMAARLDQAVGTTHDEFQVMFAYQAQDGDLIGDMDLEGYAVVAGSRHEGEISRIHMVSEMKTWEDRYTTDFPRHQLVQVARKR